MHGIPFKSKGTGIRNCTSDRYKECPWRLHVVFRRRQNSFVVLKFVNRHKNHPTSDIYFWSDCILTEEEQKHYIDHLYFEQRYTLTDVVQELYKKTKKSMKAFQLLNWANRRHPDTSGQVKSAPRIERSEVKRKVTESNSVDCVTPSDDQCLEKPLALGSFGDLKEEAISRTNEIKSVHTENAVVNDGSKQRTHSSKSQGIEETSWEDDLKVEFETSDEDSDSDGGDIDEHEDYEDVDVEEKESREGELLYVGKQYKNFDAFQQDLYKYCDATYTHARKVTKR